MRRRKPNKELGFLALGLLVLGLIGLAGWYLSRHPAAVLSPAGVIASKERRLLITGVLLSVIVVVPVFVMTIAIAVKYREGNHEKRKVAYTPDWDHSRLFEGLWWGIPCAIILVLTIITWVSSYGLDPYRPLASRNPPLTIEVVALDWKWLFIYPGQHIATVNLAEMPVNVPVAFQITSDTVMNSFWVPRLGGQIYAMPGMNTQLHLMATQQGSFAGSSANISGQGFADMTFTAKAVSQSAFNAWVHQSQLGVLALTNAAYAKLGHPTNGYPVTTYASVANGLYNDIIMKDMTPVPSSGSSGAYTP